MRSMGNQGRDDNGTWMNHVRLGYNYRLDEMSAAAGHHAARSPRRDPRPPRRVATWYNDRLRDLDGVQVPVCRPRDNADELVRLRRPAR